jgi:hypothetical protein
VANGLSGEPVANALPAAPPDPPVTRLTWPAVDRLPVVLYRIEGRPRLAGGPQYQSARVVGPIPRHLDARDLVDRQVMISCGTKRPPPGLYQIRPAAHRMERAIITDSRR